MRKTFSAFVKGWKNEEWVNSDEFFEAFGEWAWGEIVFTFNFLQNEVNRNLGKDTEDDARTAFHSMFQREEICFYVVIMLNCLGEKETKKRLKVLRA